MNSNMCIEQLLVDKHNTNKKNHRWWWLKVFCCSDSSINVELDLSLNQKKILCPFPGGEPGFFIAGGAMPSTDFTSEQQKRGLWLGNTVM